MSKKVTKKRLACGERPAFGWLTRAEDKPDWDLKPRDGEQHLPFKAREAKHLDRLRLFVFNRLDERLGAFRVCTALGRSRSLLDAAQSADRRRRREIDKVYDPAEIAGQLPSLIREIFVDYWGRSEKGPLDAYTLAAEYTSYWWDGPAFTVDQVRNRANQRRSKRHSLLPH